MIRRCTSSRGRVMLLQVWGAVGNGQGGQPLLGHLHSAMPVEVLQQVLQHLVCQPVPLWCLLSQEHAQYLSVNSRHLRTAAHGSDCSRHCWGPDPGSNAAAWRALTSLREDQGERTSLQGMKQYQRSKYCPMIQLVSSLDNKSCCTMPVKAHTCP